MAEALLGDVGIATILRFIFVVILTLFVGNAAYILIRQALERKFSNRTAKITARAIQNTLFIVGAWYALYKVVGLNLGAIATSFGVITLIIAFSSQQLVQNFIAGVLISVQKPFRIDDWVEIGLSGLARVRDITMMRTQLVDINNRFITVPNTAVLTSNVINYTSSGVVRTQVIVVYPSKEFDFNHVQEHILRKVREHKNILPVIPREQQTVVERLLARTNLPLIQRKDTRRFDPQVLILEIGMDNVRIAVRFWIVDIQRRDEIQSELLAGILEKK
jgi:small conductance mechanosensitive channel